MTKKEKLKQAILTGKVKDTKTAIEFVLKEKAKENLIKEVIAEIQDQLPKPENEEIQVELEIV